MLLTDGVLCASESESASRRDANAIKSPHTPPTNTARSLPPAVTPAMNDIVCTARRLGGASRTGVINRTAAIGCRAPLSWARAHTCAYRPSYILHEHAHLARLTCIATTYKLRNCICQTVIRIAPPGAIRDHQLNDCQRTTLHHSAGSTRRVLIDWCHPRVRAIARHPSCSASRGVRAWRSSVDSAPRSPRA